jgi:hypothetical protein
MTSLKSSPVAQALFEAVDQNWGDAHVHESFLAACAEENDLAFAAAKYREQRDGCDATRHQFAEQQLAKITGMAFAQMVAHKTPPTENKKSLMIVAAVVSGALILACLYLLTL